MAKKTPAPKSRSQSKPKKVPHKKVTSGKAIKKTAAEASAKKTVKKKTTTGKKTPPSNPKPAKKAPVRKAAAKKVTKKTVVKKASGKVTKKTPAKKAAKKTSARKTTANPAPKKRTIAKKAAPKTVKKPAKKADSTVSQSKPVKKISPTSTIKSRAKKRPGSNTTETMTASAPLRRASTVAKAAKAARRSAFTLEDVREIAKKNEKSASRGPEKTVTELKSTKPTLDLNEIKVEKRVLGAASLADILGYVPGSKTPQEDEEKKVPKKFLRYYRLLIELRDHVNSELSLHTEDTLKRSSKEDSGDLSSYSQHIADAGTDTFDRDFALSLVSSEQEALHEVEEAINRIKTGTFGICELTGKPISKERLLAVPFARYSVESQAQMEKTTRRNVHRGGIFADATAEDGVRFIQDDSDN
jgi:RNA polymerase-binding transcription factor DksA